MGDWQKWMDNELGFHVVGSEYPNLRRMLPQLRKYAISRCPDDFPDFPPDMFSSSKQFTR